MANRAAPHARDLVGRLFQKSIDQGCFFQDVRMSPAHFDELVSLTEPHLPRGRRGPPAWRIFAVLFGLAQGGPQRVIARAVDVVHVFEVLPSCHTGDARCASRSVVAQPGGAPSRKLRVFRDDGRPCCRLGWAVRFSFVCFAPARR